MTKYKIFNLCFSLGCIILLSSCNSSVDLCLHFDDDFYEVADTIKADAMCSENVENYEWAAGDGLIMLGDGASVSESFVIQPAVGQAFRTITLKVSNSKSIREQTESVIIL
jgi:hypothetical protein